MEHILVSIDARQASLGAVYRAIHLAKRIRSSVDVLLVSQPESRPSGKDSPGQEEPLRKGLDLMLERGRSDGVAMNYYVAHGDFAEEVIRFAREKKTTLLVLGLPDAAPEGSGQQKEFDKSLARIRQGVKCYIELVQQREATGAEPDPDGSSERGGGSGRGAF